MNKILVYFLAAMLTMSGDVLATPVTAPRACMKTVGQLYKDAGAMANQGRFLDAAALFEVDSTIYLHCARDPHDRLFALERLASAMALWNQAGDRARGHRLLATLQSQLSAVTATKGYRPTIEDRMTIDDLRLIIRSDLAGKFPLWSDPRMPPL